MYSSVGRWNRFAGYREQAGAIGRDGERQLLPRFVARSGRMSFAQPGTTCTGSWSVAVWFSPSVKLGGSLTGKTVMVNVRLNESIPPFAVPPSSFTVTIIVAVPDWLGSGWKLSVPVESGLLYVMVGSGIGAGLPEVAVRVRFCVSSGPAEMPVRLIVCAAHLPTTELTLVAVHSCCGPWIPSWAEKNSFPLTLVREFGYDPAPRQGQVSKQRGAGGRAGAHPQLRNHARHHWH